MTGFSPKAAVPASGREIVAPWVEERTQHLPWTVPLHPVRPLVTYGRTEGREGGGNMVTSD